MRRARHLDANLFLASCGGRGGGHVIDLRGESLLDYF